MSNQPDSRLEGAGRVALAGILNVETTVPAGQFPIDADTARFVAGIDSHPAGVACNVASALAALGRPFLLTAVSGTDAWGRSARAYVTGLPGATVGFADVPVTPHTVVLHDDNGQQAMFADPKDAMEVPLRADLTGCVAVAPTNIRPNYVAVREASAAGLPVLVDIQAAEQVDGEHNAPFCEAAEVLAMSHRNIDRPPEAWLRAMGSEWGTQTLVLGMGADGALLGRDAGRRIDHVPAVAGPVHSTVGAGDALWACFLDGYLAGRDPLVCLQRAVVFAGHKIGTAGGSRGFLSAAQLDLRCP